MASGWTSTIVMRRSHLQLVLMVLLVLSLLSLRMYQNYHNMYIHQTTLKRVVSTDESPNEEEGLQSSVVSPAVRTPSLLLNKTQTSITISPSKGLPADDLTGIYLHRLDVLRVNSLHVAQAACAFNGTMSSRSPCVDPLCTAQFASPEQRLRNILDNQYPVEAKHWDIIGSSSNQSTYRDVVFVTAASDNHFYESQGVLKDLHEKVFPFLRDHSNLTFKLVYFDLGLEAKFRQTLEMHGGCDVIRFPFEQLPRKFRVLSSCIWKPLVMKACLKHSKVTIWMDASTRFKVPDLTDILQKVLKDGLFLSHNGHMLPMFVSTFTLRYFRVTPCLLAPFYSFAGGLVAMKNEMLIHRAILDPWVACAFSPACLLPAGRFERLKRCSDRTVVYSRCHRFDQSALSVILYTLFDSRATHFLGDSRKKELFEFHRKDKVNFLPFE